MGVWLTRAGCIASSGDAIHPQIGGSCYKTISVQCVKMALLKVHDQATHRSKMDTYLHSE